MAALKVKKGDLKVSDLFNRKEQSLASVIAAFLVSSALNSTCMVDVGQGMRAVEHSMEI